MLFQIFLAQVANQGDTSVTDTLAETTLKATTAQPATSTGILDIFSHLLDDPVLIITMLSLIIFSVLSWTIIFYKFSQLKKAQKNAISFWQKFSTLTTLSEAVGIKTRSGPLFELFAAGQEVVMKIKKSSGQLTDYHKKLIEQKMAEVREEEAYKLEQFVSFLATVASATPFIGLFGTVWGILRAFLKIGQAGSSSLATVGPHIAEALVATAVGLFAAIPAVMFYNFFIGKIRIINKMISLFINDFFIKTDKEFSS